MSLGYNIIIIALVAIILFLTIYIYRKQIFTSHFQKHSIQSFKTELKIFLKNSFPNIVFDFSIFQKVKEEKDSRVRQVLITENIALQFVRYDFKIETQPSIGSDLLWSTYEYDCKPLKNKAPKNLQRIKEYAYKRDNCACLRCGRELRLAQANIAFVKALKDEGTYHFENIMTVCVDCNKVLNTDNTSLIGKDLPLIDEILQKTDF